jgi:hypothetical protein
MAGVRRNKQIARDDDYGEVYECGECGNTKKLYEDPNSPGTWYCKACWAACGWDPDVGGSGAAQAPPAAAAAAVAAAAVGPVDPVHACSVQSLVGESFTVAQIETALHATRLSEEGAAGAVPAGESWGCAGADDGWGGADESECPGALDSAVAFEGAERQWDDEEEDETALALLREEEEATARIDRERERQAVQLALEARALAEAELAKKVGNEEAWAEKAKLKADHKAAQRLDWTCKCQAQNHWECRTCFKCDTRRVKPPKAPKPPKPMVHKACLHQWKCHKNGHVHNRGSGKYTAWTCTKCRAHQERDYKK